MGLPAALRAWCKMSSVASHTQGIAKVAADRELGPWQSQAPLCERLRVQGGSVLRASALEAAGQCLWHVQPSTESI